LNVQQPRKLDRHLLDRGLLAVNVDQLGCVVVAQTVVQVPRRPRLANVQEDVVEDDLLVVFGRRLEIALKVQRLPSLAVEESVRSKRAISCTITKYAHQRPSY
jgi:hypothetical protein